jgi:hypothetical protein
MEHVTITWSFENWITVLIMVALGFTGLGLIFSVINRNQAA